MRKTVTSTFALFQINVLNNINFFSICRLSNPLSPANYNCNDIDMATFVTVYLALKSIRKLYLHMKTSQRKINGNAHWLV